MPVQQDLIDGTEPLNIVTARGWTTYLDNVRGMTLRVIRGPVWVTHTEPPTIAIAHGGMTCLDNVRGMTLRVMRGPVWVTQSGSNIDVSLDAGESFCVARNGRTLVSADQDAPAALVALEPPMVAIGPTLSERLNRIFAL